MKLLAASVAASLKEVAAPPAVYATILFRNTIVLLLAHTTQPVYVASRQELPTKVLSSTVAAVMVSVWAPWERKYSTPA